MIFENFSIDHLGSVEVTLGKPYPIGATVDERATNFAAAAEDTHKVVLHLHGETNPSRPSKDIELDSEFHKTGNFR